LFFGTFAQLRGQQYNFIKYSVQDGLPQSQVYAAIEDRNGYIWYGTQGGGITRFDGLDFKTFTTKEKLPSNYINSITEDNIGKIWIGTNTGLCYFNGIEIKNISKDKPIHINTIFQKNDSILWIGTTVGLYQYQINTDSLSKLKLHKQLNKIGVNEIIQGKNKIWFASNSGLWSFDKSNEKIKRYSKRSGIKGNIVQALLLDKNEKLWIASYEGGMNILNTKTNKLLEFKNNPNVKKPLCLFEGNNNDIWIGTRDKGISIYNTTDSTWTNITEKKGLPHNHIRKILKDSWNNVWVCTSGGGVAKYLDRFFEYYNTSNGLHGKYIYALANGINNKILISASNNGLSNYNGNGFNKIISDSNFINVKSKTILTDTIGRIWVGTEGKGIVIMDSLGYKVINEKTGFPSNWIRSLVQDRNRSIWAATYTKGIVKIEKEDSANYKFTTFDRKDGLPDIYISTFKKSRDNKLWFATKYGKIGYFEDDEIKKVYSENDGLPKLSIRSIAFDKYGKIWVATAGKGIFSASINIKKSIFKRLTSEKKLHSDNIYLLIFDKEGNLWAGSESGVDKISFNNIGVISDIQHYGRNEGFLGIETCQNSALLDKEGNLWFGTMNGLVKHTDVERTKTKSTPKIHFEKISLFYKSLSKTKYKDFVSTDGSLIKGLKLKYNDNHLSFDFKAINQSSPTGIKYRWLLEENEREWSPFTLKNSVDYSNLEPGKYTFRVQASTKDGNKSEIIKASFFILKPFWQEWWFKISTLLLFGLIFWFWQRNWKKKIQKREAIKRDKLEMKNHVLQLEQKALQLQMNPHFIFNALNSIQSLVALNDTKNARVQISNFASLMRGILSNSKKEKISLVEEIAVLKKYLNMEQFCQRVPFKYEINVDQNIDVEEIDLAPMILQPFVENAVIHGISHLQKDGVIQISFFLQKDILTCEIQDNGVGRKKAAELRQTLKPGHQSISMEVTKQRLEAMKGNKKYKALEISDILGKSGSLTGTKVLVKIPINLKY